MPHFKGCGPASVLSFVRLTSTVLLRVCLRGFLRVLAPACACLTLGGWTEEALLHTCRLIWAKPWSGPCDRYPSA